MTGRERQRTCGRLPTAAAARGCSGARAEPPALHGAAPGDRRSTRNWPRAGRVTMPRSCAAGAAPALPAEPDPRAVGGGRQAVLHPGVPGPLLQLLLAAVVGGGRRVGDHVRLPRHGRGAVLDGEVGARAERAHAPPSTPPSHACAMGCCLLARSCACRAGSSGEPAAAAAGRCGVACEG